MEKPYSTKQPLGFWKTVLAAFIAFLGANIIGTLITLVLFFSILAGIATTFSSGSGVMELKTNSVLKISLSTISEKVVTDDWRSLPWGFGIPSKEETPVSLTDALASIRKAKEDDRIRGIYLNLDNYAGGMASTIDLRAALEDFKKSGKFIYAYADGYGQKAYYLSSVADKVILNPEGTVQLVGLASSNLFFKGALDKLGIKAEIFKVGTYKSAVEPFMLDHMSEPNKEQVSEYLSGVWNYLLQGISSSRKIPVDSLRQYADNGIAFGEAADFVRHRLVDTLAYRLDVADLVARRVGVKTEDLHQVGLADLIGLPDPAEKGRLDDPAISVLYAEGEISEQGDGITADLARQLRDLRSEDDVKAVVLRINSPGGSAFLSEQIWHEVKSLRATGRKVVVSMGDVAASGGYYIASAADAIVASPMTLTGSIGIFGMLPDASELAKRFGLNVDVVQTSRYADMDASNFFGFSLRPLTPEQRALIQHQVERGYKTFLSRVSEGRKIAIPALDSIAQGRVWLGAKAKELGLVDELGGLDVAIRYAAKLAGLKEGNYQVYYGETSQSWLDQLFSSENSDSFQARLRRVFMSDEEKKLQELLRFSTHYRGIQARLPYEYQAY